MPDEVPEWTWDPEKARSNRHKHGVSFPEAVAALEDPLALTVRDRARHEERLVTLGQDSEGRLIVVVWIQLERGGRIISARKATPRERRSYEEGP
ncbi:MAG TPA: BrnT family toxin [Thermoanaerobaculia bacterium]|nr:BrnT family toxin [Thermoanaerobaculia bacterium]